MPEYHYPPMDGYQTVLQEMASRNPKAAAMNPKELVDARFVKELEDSGFIARLSKQPFPPPRTAVSTIILILAH
jgi:hypothetical protein